MAAAESGPFRVVERTERVQVWAVPTSAPAALASTECATADDLVAELGTLLGAGPAEPIDIFLVEPVPGGTSEGAEGDGNASPRGRLIREVGPDAFGPPLSVLLAERLVGALVDGPVRYRAVFGLALLAESQLGTAPPIDTLEATLRGDDDPLGSPAGWASLVSFVASRTGPAGVVELVTRPADEPDDGPFPQLDALAADWFAHLQSRMTEMRGWRRMLAHLRPLASTHKWRLLELLSYIVLGLVFTIGLPLASSYLIDGVLPSGDTRLLVIFVAVLAAIAVYDAALDIRSEYASTDVNLQVFRSLQLQMFTNLQRLSHDFYGRSRVGDVMSRMSTDLAMVQQTAGQVLGGTISAVLTFVAAIIAISALSPFIGLAVLAVLPLIALAYRVYGGQLATASLAVQENIGDTQAYLQQSLQAQEVTKAFRAERLASDSFAQRVTRTSRATLRMSLLGGKLGASIGLANGLPQLAIMGIGGYLVMTDRLSLGVLVALLGLVPSVFSPITSLSEIAQDVRQTTGAVQRVVELLDEQPSITDPPGADDAPPCARGVRFSNVSFAYPTGRLVLDDVTLEIPAGSRVAIVGPSGSGKSTLLSLLVRFWDPSAGSVEIDGVDVREVGLDSLRARVGLVMQDTFVFDDSLRANVAIGRPDASDDEILRALHAAELTEFVDALPHGLDTRMGESTRASGGQRQRLALARVLLLDPPILALDEPTSALDSQTERAVLGTMATVAAGRTTIMVTHRLAAAHDADLVVVMESGRVVEAGTHHDLLAAGGAYSRLHEHHSADATRTAASMQLDALERTSLFRTATSAALVELAAGMVPEHFEEGDEVVRAGERGDRMYIVANGRLEVAIRDDGLGWRDVGRLTTGDLFGELALLGTGIRTATVRATTPVLLWSLSREAFDDVVRRHPDLGTAVDESMEARIGAYQFATSPDQLETA